MKTFLGLTLLLALAIAALALDASGYLTPATDVTPDLLMVVASARG